MLELEKNSSKSTSVDDTSHSFTPTSNVRNGFRRKKGDSPFTYNLNLKVKKEKKQSNCTNPILEVVGLPFGDFTVNFHLFLEYMSISKY